MSRPASKKSMPTVFLVYYSPGLEVTYQIECWRRHFLDLNHTNNNALPRQEYPRTLSTWVPTCLLYYFVNDIIAKDSARPKYFMYANDRKIFTKIWNVEDSVCIQMILEAVDDWWCEAKKMMINGEKCYVATFTRSVTILYTHQQ